MSALKVLTAGVSIVVFAAHAFGATAGNSAAGWADMQQAGTAALQAHNYGDAERIFESSLPLAKSNTQRANTYSSWGIALIMQRRNKQAKITLEHAISEWQGLRDSDKIPTYGVLASLERILGDYGEAERLLRDAISDPVATPGDRAMLSVHLADLLREQGLDDEALAALSGCERTDGLNPEPLNTDLRAKIAVERAQLYRDMHRWDESIELWNRVAETAEKTHSAQLEQTVASGLGETWLNAGNLARAEPLLRRAVQLTRDDPWAGPTQLGTALSTLAHLYLAEDKLALAEETLGEAISKNEDALGISHPQVAILLELKAMILTRRGEVQAARNELERAKGIMSAHFGPDSLAVGVVHAEMGEVEARAGRPEAAVMEYGTAMAMLSSADPAHSKFGPTEIEHYAAALKAVHRGDEAKALLKTLRSIATPTGASAYASGTQSFRQR